MILARRIEDVLTKQQIIELYLNQISLGRNALRRAGGGRAYFDKDVDQLDPAADGLSRDPAQGARTITIRDMRAERALARRNWVLDEMATNGHITAGAARRRRRPRRSAPSPAPTRASADRRAAISWRKCAAS